MDPPLFLSVGQLVFPSGQQEYKNKTNLWLKHAVSLNISTCLKLKYFLMWFPCGKTAREFCSMATTVRSSAC